MSFGSKLGEKTAHSFCAFTSSIFGFLFLNLLFLCALAKNIWTVHTVKTNTLEENDRKLVLDIAYYAKLQNFQLDEYEVTTDDGFILQVHRLVTPKEDDSKNTDTQRYPVLLIPGLMQSSAAYCTAGPRAIAFELVRAGYDVWLGNNRGGFHPKHNLYKPRSPKMWDWSMQDYAKYDVPAMVQFVKMKTNARKIALVAHSQGTTQSFMALSRESYGGIPDLGTSISSFSALAPAVYAGPLVDRWFLRMLRVGHHTFHLMFGYRAFIGLMGNMREFLPINFFAFVGYLVFKYMLGWNDLLWDIRYRNRDFISAPVYVSSKLMYWWLGKGGFADRKCIFASSTTKWFDERFPPLELYACGHDDLVLPDPLVNRIHTHEEDVRDNFRVISLPTYSHLDVLWAQDAHETVAAPMTEFIWKNVSNKNQWRTPSLFESQRSSTRSVSPINSVNSMNSVNPVAA